MQATNPDDPERALVAAAREGDRAAFGELVRRHAGKVRMQVLPIVRNEADAADVAQEAFVRAYRQLDSFKGESRFGAWLRRIAVNTALMRLRARRRRPETSLDAMLPNFVEDGHHAAPVERIHTGCPEDALLHRQAIHQALSELPDHYREVVLMRRVEGLDTEEAARQLGISTNAVKLRLHRAHQALVAALARRDEAQP